MRRLDDWKNLFGIAHNSLGEYGNTNVIDIEKFKSTKNLIDNNLKFVINNARDSGTTGLDVRNCT